jgi:streptogramin lyase
MRTLRILIPLVAVMLVAAAWAAQSPSSGPAASGTPLKGIVKAADGSPMEGVAVSMRADGKNIRTTVYTDRNGQYYFPPLESDQYNVLVQAVGYDAGRLATRLDAGRTEERNFTLTPLKDFSRQLSGIEWMASLPEDTPQLKRAKRILGVNCNQCHAVGTIMQNRFDFTGWTAIVRMMETTSWNGNLFAPESANGQPDPYIRGYHEEIVGYLTRVAGPDSKLNLKPLARMTGDATQIVVTEYDISPGHLPGYLVTSNGSDWSLGTASHHESRAVHDHVVDLDGYVWFTDNVTPKRSIGKLDPRTGKVTDYTHLSEKGMPVGVHDINVDQEGNIWFNSGGDGTLDKFDPKTEKFTHYALPADGSVPRGVGGLIGVDSKGNIWGRVGGRSVEDFDPKLGIKFYRNDGKQKGGAVRLDPKTGKYAYYPALTPAMSHYSIGVDALDNAWVTRPDIDQIVHIDTKTSDVHEISMSRRDRDDVLQTSLDKELAAKFEPHRAAATGPVWQQGPRRQVQSYWTAMKFAEDKNFDAHYFTLSKASKIAKADVRTRKVTEYPLPHPYSFPYMVTIDKNQMVWVSAMNTDRVYKFNPKTEQWTDYELPTRGTDSRSIDVDNTKALPEVWLSYWGTSQLARVQFRTPEAYRASGAGKFRSAN